MKNLSEISLLEHTEVGTLLREMILQKDQRYKKIQELRQLYLNSDEYSHLDDDFRSFFLEQVFDICKEGAELPIIERDLRNMCFALRKKEKKFQQNTRWEEQYEYATEQIRIEEVVSRLLNIDNWKRNIRCPFHEDKSPSFKIYTKSNRFVCFGCNARGSPIDFVMQYQNCSFKEAVHFLSP